MNIWKTFGHKIKKKVVAKFLIHDLLSQYNFTKQDNLPKKPQEQETTYLGMPKKKKNKSRNN